MNDFQILFYCSLMVNLFFFIYISFTVSHMRQVQQKFVDFLTTEGYRFIGLEAKFRETAAHISNWQVQSIKYLLIAMARYIDCIKCQAVEDERYEDAKRCQQVIEEMNKLINS